MGSEPGKGKGKVSQTIVGMLPEIGTVLASVLTREATTYTQTKTKTQS